MNKKLAVIIVLLALAISVIFVVRRAGHDNALPETPPSSNAVTAEPSTLSAQQTAPDDLFGGRSVREFYVQTCGGCHGPGRRGAIGPALLPSALTESREFYFNVVKNGRPGTIMPAWGPFGLSDAQIEALVAYIFTEPSEP